MDDHAQLACNSTRPSSTRSTGWLNKNAAVLVKDVDAENEMVAKALELINDEAKLADLSKNILTLAQRDSANRIADEVVKLIKK